MHEDRALAARVRLLAVLAHVEAHALVLLADAERRGEGDQPQQDIRADEGVDRGRERRLRLIPELARIAEEQPVTDPVPGELREQADEENADEAAEAVCRENVERLVEPCPRPPHDEQVARDRADRAEEQAPTSG